MYCKGADVVMTDNLDSETEKILVKKASGIPVDIRTDGLEDPLGIGSRKPKFSWSIYSNEHGYIQSGYRILVSSDIEKLNNENGDMWDSGKVESFQQYAVVYQGKKLSSVKKYYWKVMIFDSFGNRSDWSETASFETSIIYQSEWIAKFIGGYNVRMVRNSISVSFGKKIVSARAYVSSPGYFVFHVNGKIIGDHLLDPVQTNPDMRLLYVTFDVTGIIGSGENILGAQLGYGGICGLTGARCNVSSHRNDDGSRYFIMQLHVKYSDGTSDIFITDENWKGITEGPIIFDELYGGETYDATREVEGWDKRDFDDGSWTSVISKSIGNRIMAAQLVHIKPVEEITPIRETYLNGKYIFDLGRNISGRPVIKIKGKKGSMVEMHFGEKLYEDGNVDSRSTRNDWTCRYILKGEGMEDWRPTFSISGFRYISVSCSDTPLTAIDIKAEFVTSAVKRKGWFESSSDKLNKIHNMYLLSQRANISTGVPVDCPHRERLGWLGDAILITDPLGRNYDVYNMYMKWFDDMNDELFRSGRNVWRNHIPNPSHYDKNPNPFDVPWYSGNIEIPWTVYKTYGDVTIIEKNYERMKALISYLHGKTKNYLITETGAWGDWVSVLGRYNITNSYLSTGYYYRCVYIMIKAAKVLGKTNDMYIYEDLAIKIRNAINEKWLIDGSYYDTGTQSANALALDFGMVPEEHEDEVLQTLAEDIIKRDYHITTGVTGTYNIFRALSKYGRDDILYNVMVRESYPSYGYMLYNGATTPWEFWNNATDTMSSWNHTFLAGPAESWLNNSVAGITPIEAGYRKIKIKPAMVGDLKSAKGSFESVYGLISSGWMINKNKITMDVEIPANTTAEVYIPVSCEEREHISIIGNSLTIWNRNTVIRNKYIEYLKTDKENIVFKVVSGRYRFEVISDDKQFNFGTVHYDTLEREGVTIQAVSYSAKSGIIDKGESITGLDPWDYIEYSNIDMTDVSDIQVSLKADWGSDKRAIDFRLDSPEGRIISSLYVSGTREKNAEIYHIESAQVIRSRGIHKLYMTFRGGIGICEFNKIKLVRSESKCAVLYAEPVKLYAAKNSKPLFPSSVTVCLEDGTTEKRSVEWECVSTYKTGIIKVHGSIDGTDVKANLTLIVTDKPYIISVPDITHYVYGDGFDLPLTVSAEYSDKTIRSVLVLWEAVDENSYTDDGELIVYGIAEGTDIKVKANVKRCFNQSTSCG